MRYPDNLRDNGRIGFVAPSFGCATEPYKSAFNNALSKFGEMGYTLVTGPNCYEALGIGISNINVQIIYFMLFIMALRNTLSPNNLV